MPKLPTLSSKQVLKVLQAQGFDIKHTTGSHYVLQNIEKNKILSVPFHTKDLPKGTLHAIIKASGLAREDFT